MERSVRKPLGAAVSRRIGRATWVTGLLAVCALACAKENGGADRDTRLPQRLAGLELVESRSGPAAAKLISRLHGRRVAPSESAVGLYGPERMRVSLYVSRFPSASEADSQLRRMAERIGGGVSGFGHYRSFQVAERQIHVTFGEGAVHYFFRSDDELSWLSAPPTVARAAAAAALGVELDSIPELMSGDAAR